MSNYPPGVTWNEYAIAGPDYEYESDLIPCWFCDNREENIIQVYRSSRWLICGECNQQTDLEDDGPDPDEAYDRMKDRGY